MEPEFILKAKIVYNGFNLVPCTLCLFHLGYFNGRQSQ
jgi:hypothetical protein